MFLSVRQTAAAQRLPPHATATVGNSIFYANYDDDSTTGDELEQVGRYSGGTASISRCLIQGWTAGVTGGVGNFDGNPLFVSVLGNDGIQGTYDGNLRLMRNSPCIDRGALADAPTDPTDLNHNGIGGEMLPFDADGRARLRDNLLVSNLNGAAIDLGAYESQFGVPGDMNCDGLVNNFDIDPFVIALTDPGTYHVMFPSCESSNGDANADGLFNNFDITPFVDLLVN